jgi:hypothetical protein
MLKDRLALTGAVVVTAGLLGSANVHAQAQGDGPRAYQMLPEGVHALTV